MEEKDIQHTEEKRPAPRKVRPMLTVEERILFAVVLILFGCIILVNAINTADFTPVVQYTGPNVSSVPASTAESSLPMIAQDITSATPSRSSTSSAAPIPSATPSTEAHTANPIPSTLSSTVNINTALKEELMTLKGIGEVKAQAILDYRLQNGPFHAVEDLLNVKGIGEKTLENIKNQICIE